MRRAMIQTGVLFLDAYRELNAKRMFWITLALSGLVVLAFASVGLSERGVTFLTWTLPHDYVNSRFIPPEQFYRILFAQFGVPFYLTWIAAILALISTASIFPDFVSGGSIESMLSKPIGRVRLFLTKYVAGLLFVALQVLVFSVACFLVIGIRGNSWEPRILLAIPIVVCFFSYLFCVLAVLGLLTRSTIAALLATLLFWFAVFIVNTTEGALLFDVERRQLVVDRLKERIERQEEFVQLNITQSRDQGFDTYDGRDLPEGARDELEAMFPPLKRSRDRLEEAERGLATFETWHWRARALKTVLPKTSETIGLLDRYLLTTDEAMTLGQGSQRERDATPPELDLEEPQDAVVRQDDPELHQRMHERTRERSLWWIIGTSMGFQGAVLLFGAWRFRRRDF